TVTLTFSKSILGLPDPIITNGTIECFGSDCPTGINNICFVLYKVAADGLSAEFCYYLGGANTNNLFGGDVFYVFTVQYGPTGNTIDGCPPETPLPVKLKSFAASRNNSEVNLKWSTETEQN